MRHRRFPMPQPRLTFATNNFSKEDIVLVVLTRSTGCPSPPAQGLGLPIPADNFPNELARVCDSVGKSPRWRGLEAAFPSQFVMDTAFPCSFKLIELSWSIGGIPQAGHRFGRPQMVACHRAAGCMAIATVTSPGPAAMTKLAIMITTRGPRDRFRAVPPRRSGRGGRLLIFSC